MEKVYRRFKGRQTQRRNAFKYWLALWAFFILFGAVINSNLKWLFGTWISVAFLTSISCGLFIMTRSWANETIEISIFVNLYEAFKDLELYSKKDEKSRFYLTKVKNHIEEAINHLSNLYYRKPLSSLFEREFVEPLERFKENLETIILPRITQQRDIEKMVTVLRSLAETFSEALKPITFQDIAIMNEQIEQYKTRGITVAIESRPAPMRTLMRKIQESTIGRVLVSLVLGYGLILIVCAFIVLPQNLAVFVKEKPETVILGGSAIFSGIMFLWKNR